MNPEAEPSHLIELFGMRLSSSDVIKIIVAIVAAAVAWTALQAKLDAVNTRLDNRERQENIYLRSDVQALRDENILTDLRALASRLERIEKKIDQAH